MMKKKILSVALTIAVILSISLLAASCDNLITVDNDTTVETVTEKNSEVVSGITTDNGAETEMNSEEITTEEKTEEATTAELHVCEDADGDHKCDGCSEIVYSKGLEITNYISSGEPGCYLSGIGDCTDTEIYIPPYIDGRKVTAIYSDAFQYCDNITKVVIPDSVQWIGQSAFSGCDNLVSVIIPDTVVSIGNSAFADCRNLSDIKLPAGLASIRDRAFSNCQSITSMTIPEGVESIGNMAFRGCKGMTRIDLPMGLKDLGRQVFQNCTNLEGISIPYTVLKLDFHLLEGCTNLKSIYYNASVQSWTYKAKDYTWNYKLSGYTVYCTDGEADK